MQRRKFQFRSVRDIRRRGIGVRACGGVFAFVGIVAFIAFTAFIACFVRCTGEQRERTVRRQHARDNPAVRIHADGRHHVSQRHPPYRAAAR